MIFSPTASTFFCSFYRNGKKKFAADDAYWLYHYHRHFRFICLVRWWLKWWHIDSANWIMDNDDVVSGDVVGDYNDLDDDDDDDEPLDTPWFIHE